MDVLIWSNEHMAWWQPAERGYTKDVTEAGAYPIDRAMEICINANRYQPDGSIPNEAIVPIEGVSQLVD